MASGQTVGQDGGRRGRRLPFDAAERKKIIVLVVLAAVCGVVVLPQLWKSKGPATANAATASGSGTTVDIESVVSEMRSSLTPPVKSEGGEAVFVTVDEALDLFVGSVRPQPVPVERLRLAVFGVPEAAEAKDAASVKSVLALKAAGQLNEGDPLKAELEKLNLETVMISSRNRAAIINGEVLHLGEMIEGFKIVAIEIGQVSLVKDGRPAKLKLK